MKKKVEFEIYKKLLDYIESLPIINCHEHLPETEEIVNKMPRDIFSCVNYMHDDLISAGISEEEAKILRGESKIKEKWDVFKKYYPYIRFTSYGRAMQMLFKEFLDIDEFDENNIEYANNLFIKLEKHEHPYNFLLKQKGNILISLVTGSDIELDRKYLKRVLTLDPVLSLYTQEEIDYVQKVSGKKVISYEDYIEAVKIYYGIMIKTRGYKIFKLGLAYYRNLNFSEYDVPEAKKEFEERFVDGKLLEDYSFDNCTNFVNSVFNCVLNLLENEEIVLQIHTGLFANGKNIIENGNPTELNKTFIKYPNIKFDIFHISYPYAGELVALSKMFGNVYVNFAWAHAISERKSVETLLECFDVLPINKILAFGGDSHSPVWTYAYLIQARKNIAKAIAIAISEGVFTIEEGKWIAKRILFDNPNELYKLGYKLIDTNIINRPEKVY